MLVGFNTVAVKQPNVATSYWRPSRPCQANEMLINVRRVLENHYYKLKYKQKCLHVILLTFAD